MAENCGGVAATNKKQRISFITSNSRGNGLPAATGGASSCIFPGTTTYEKVQQNINSWVVSPQDLVHFGETGQMPNQTLYQHTQEVVVQKTVGGFMNNWVLYPFYINVEADMEVFYRTVGGENHLIVSLSNIFSTIIGGQNYDNQNQNCSRELIPGYGDPFAFRLAISVTPTPNDGDWKSCFGGWWLEPQLGCTASCAGLRNPPGGFNYYWGCRQQDTPFARSPYPGRMNAGPYEWDLGTGIDTAKNLIYVTGQTETSSNRSNPCAGMHPKLGTSQFSNAYSIPPLNVCPPEVTGITQGVDICENCAIVDFGIAGNDLLGTGQGSLFIEYVWNATLANVDWSNAEGKFFTMYQDQPLTAELPCLEGNSHYAYRMKIILNTSYEAESEYVYGEFDTLFIPPVNMSVPPLLVGDCTTLNRGGEIPEFNKIVSYESGKVTP